MTMKIVLQSLQKQVERLSQFIELFAASLGNPSLRRSEVNRGYRFDNPDVRHFCLLNTSGQKSSGGTSLSGACLRVTEIERGQTIQPIKRRRGTRIAEHLKLVLGLLDR